MVTNNNNSAIIYHHTFPKPCQLLQTLIKLQNSFWSVKIIMAQNNLNSHIFLVSGAMSPTYTSLDFIYLAAILIFWILSLIEVSNAD